MKQSQLLSIILNSVADIVVVAVVVAVVAVVAAVAVVVAFVRRLFALHTNPEADSAVPPPPSLTFICLIVVVVAVVALHLFSDCWCVHCTCFE